MELPSSRIFLIQVSTSVQTHAPTQVVMIIKRFAAEHKKLCRSAETTHQLCKAQRENTDFFWFNHFLPLISSGFRYFSNKLLFKYTFSEILIFHNL